MPHPLSALARPIAAAITPACAYAVRRGGPALRRQMWRRICQPYLSWRDHDFEVATSCGFRFAGNAADMVPRYVYYFGIWEPTISAFVQSLALGGRTFVDVGANLGWYSLLASRRVGPSGRVVAIEASPPVFQGLRRNLSLNGADNVRTVQGAVWHEKGELDLFSGPSHNLGSTSLNADHPPAGAAAGRPSYRVAAAPLGDWLTPQEIASAAVVKIDVEGAEREVVEGMLDMLRAAPQDVKLLMELTPDGNGRAEHVIEQLRRLGFGVYRMENDYSPDFYFSPPPVRFLELVGEIRELSDVVFSRERLS